MDYSDHDHSPAGLEAIETRLRAERATAAPLELDRIKLRAIRQAEQSQPSYIARKKGTLMKSRLALTLMIATGVLMGTTGATLAISGSSGSGSAASNQYCAADDASEDCSGELGGTDSGELGGSGGGDSGELNTSDESVPPPAEQVATAETDSETLPFTGLAAIPLLILGLGFVSVGLLLRFKANRDT